MVVDAGWEMGQACNVEDMSVHVEPALQNQTPPMSYLGRPSVVRMPFPDTFPAKQLVAPSSGPPGAVAAGEIGACVDKGPHM